MLMRTVLQNRESVILEPIQEPTIGWYIRPGTVRVAQPYDSNAHNIHAGDSQDVRTLSDTHSSPETSEPSHKRQKRSKTKAGNSSDLDQELIQWIKTEFLSIIEHDSSRLWIRDMLGDYFYGTFVDAPASNTFALDLIKLQPTLQMLKSGFTPTGNRDALKDQEILSFDRLELENGSQQLDLDDFYEVLVMNGHSEPALVTFATEGRPRYLMPPRSGFVVSDLNAVHGLKGVGKFLH
ncbi:hypothetical protein BGX31_005029 [Mortierella sp. GBA43]|nr:hypothetical protein BGX31_005029 [Mortierella sp. GBA43]